MKLNLSTKIILVIEDYSVMRKAIKDMLYSLGAQYIFEAENATAGIAAMNKQKFDVIICDYSLGEGKNGQQLLEEARYKRLIAYHTLFVMVSAHQSAGLVLSTIENKPDEFLAKPFNAHQLFIRLQRSFQRKQVFAPIEREVLRDNYTKAIALTDDLLATSHKSLRTQLLKLRAELAINTGDFGKAKQIYQQVLEDRELPWARLGMGIICFLQEDFEQAISIFEALIEQNVLFMEAYDWLTRSFEVLKQLNQAENTLRQATEISPHSFFKQKKLAQLATKIDHLETAEKAYLAVADLGRYSVHSSPEDLSGLAKVYLKQNKPNKALRTLEALSQQFTNNPEAELRVAVLETEIYQKTEDQSKLQQAQQKFRQLALQLKDDVPPDLQLDIARQCYLNQDKADIAMADKMVALLILNHIDDENFMDDIRHVQEETGQKNSADALIQQTRKELIDINNRGVKLYQQGHFEEAFDIFEQAAKRMPKNKIIITNMTKLLLHDLKESGITEDKLLLTYDYLKKAKQVGIATDKLGQLKMEFERIIHTPPTLI